MVFDHRDLRARVFGRIAYVWNRRASTSIVTDHHTEIHDLLSLLREIGEATNLAPLKGIVGIIQLIFDRAQTMRALSTATAEMMQFILLHLKSIADVLCCNADFARSLAINSLKYRHVFSCLEQYESQLRCFLEELKTLAPNHRKFWRQTRLVSDLGALQRRFNDATQIFQSQCVLMAVLNSSPSPPLVPQSTPSPCLPIVLHHDHDVPGVRRLDDITQVIYERKLPESGFFSNMFIGTVEGMVSKCLIKEVPKARSKSICLFMLKTLARKHSNLPQLLRTLLTPGERDLLLIFHSPGQGFQEMGYALGVGNFFWPGKIYYEEMRISWRSTQSNFTITPEMAQTALVDSRGFVLFAYPEYSQAVRRRKPHRKSVISGDASENTPTDDTDELLDSSAEDLGSDDESVRDSGEGARQVVLRLGQVVRRIDLLSKHEQPPDKDDLRQVAGSLIIHEDPAGSDDANTTASEESAIAHIVELERGTTINAEVPGELLGTMEVNVKISITRDSSQETIQALTSNPNDFNLETNEVERDPYAKNPLIFPIRETPLTVPISRATVLYTCTLWSGAGTCGMKLDFYNPPNLRNHLLNHHGMHRDQLQRSSDCNISCPDDQCKCRSHFTAPCQVLGANGLPTPHQTHVLDLLQHYMEQHLSCPCSDCGEAFTRSTRRGHLRKGCPGSTPLPASKAPGPSPKNTRSRHVMTSPTHARFVRSRSSHPGPARRSKY